MERTDRKPRPIGLLASDTSSESERIQLRIWSEISPLEKTQAVADVSTSARELSLAGIRLRHPTASEEECRLRYALITLGRPLAYAAYPDARDLVER